MGVIFIPTNKTYENLEKMMFSGVGEYGIPEIMPEQYKKCEWIGFNYAASTERRAGGKRGGSIQCGNAEQQGEKGGIPAGI